MRLIDADALVYKLGVSDQDIYCKEIIEEEPTALPERQEIGYGDCADATLKMWMDSVITDGEYKRIMDKLNKYWMREGQDERHNKD